MIKRPLHKRFNHPVKMGRKTTTIRRKPWPIGKPIMLYHWETEPYKSPQQDVAVIVVDSVTPIRINHTLAGLIVFEAPNMDRRPALWSTEGFDNDDELREWFKAVVKKGETIEQYLMSFHLSIEHLLPPVPPEIGDEKVLIELKRTLDDFFLILNPHLNLADALICTGLCTLGMITASAPAEEQQLVFDDWLIKMQEAWPSLRAITTVVPG